MGMPTGFSRSKTAENYEELKISKYDPNPSKFMIIKRLTRGNNSAVLVNYPNCINYEGRKVLVYRDTHPLNIDIAVELDPHFREGDNLIKPFARFEPTEDGWDKAVMLLDLI